MKQREKLYLFILPCECCRIEQFSMTTVTFKKEKVSSEELKSFGVGRKEKKVPIGFALSVCVE